MLLIFSKSYETRRLKNQLMGQILYSPDLMLNKRRQYIFSKLIQNLFFNGNCCFQKKKIF